MRKTMRTYVLTPYMACIAYPVSPCNIKGCIIISLTCIHSTKHPEWSNVSSLCSKFPSPPPLYNLTLSSSQWPPHNHPDQLAVFYSQDHHACRTHSISALEVRPSASQTAGIYYRSLWCPAAPFPSRNLYLVYNNSILSIISQYYAAQVVCKRWHTYI